MRERERESYVASSGSQYTHSCRILHCGRSMVREDRITNACFLTDSAVSIHLSCIANTSYMYIHNHCNNIQCPPAPRPPTSFLMLSMSSLMIASNVCTAFLRTLTFSSSVLVLTMGTIRFSIDSISQQSTTITEHTLGRR